MAKEVLTIDGRRDAYSIDQMLKYENTMTVGELIELLSNYDEDMPVMINNDNGYTYGAIKEWDSFRVEESEEDYDEDEDEDEDEDDEEEEEDDDEERN